MNAVEQLYQELMELVKLRYVNIRYNHDKTLVMFKYSRKAFWSNLWDKYPALKEARGIVFTNPETTKKTELVVRPFTKVFNIGENETDLDPNAEYHVFRKVNGFMASVSWDFIRSEWLVTTTGSFDSDYVQMAKEKLKLDKAPPPNKNYTFLYEIVHENDPHIVYETPGAYLLCARLNVIGQNTSNYQYQDILPIISDLYLGKMTRGEILVKSTMVNHEGFAIYNQNCEMVAKIKSPHYRAKKFLMRVKGEKIGLIWTDFEKAKRVFSDEEFWPIMHQLRNNIRHEKFVALPEQARREFLENMECY